MEVYKDALSIVQSIGDKRAEGVILGELGNVSNDLSLPTEGISYYETLKSPKKERQANGRRPSWKLRFDL